MKNRKFPIGFALIDEQGNIFKDETYFKFAMFSKTFDKNEKIPQEKIFDVTLCSNTKLFGPKFNNYFCPIKQDYSIEGTFLNNKYQMLGFMVDK